MVALACYIIWKTRRLDLDAAAKVMQKNVAGVAVLFCICHVPALIQYGEVAFQEVGETMTTLNNATIPREVTSFFWAVNNGANIFIYTAFSKQFRTTLFSVLIECGP
jgi:hypothetical protein